MTDNLKEDLVKSILDFLEQNQFTQAKIFLEKESSVRLQSYGKEIDFFYDLIADGMLEDAIQFLSPLRNRPDFSHSRAVFQLKRQMFLEEIETGTNLDVHMLASLVRELETIAEKHEFNELCSLLTLDSVKQHKNFSQWTVTSSRLDCFNKCLKYLGRVYPLPTHPQTVSNLLELFEFSKNYKSSPIDMLKKSFELETIVPTQTEKMLKEKKEKEKIEKEKKAKKKVSWNVSPTTPVAEIIPDEGDSIQVFVEPLDIMGNTDEISFGGSQDEPVKTNMEIMLDLNPSTLRELASIQDNQAIRAACFNTDGDYFALGTNSKSIKICSMHNIVDGILYNQHQGREQSIDIVFEHRSAHYGSVYCIDWSKQGKFIASGSNDRSIHILKWPDFLNMQETQEDTVVLQNGKFEQGEGNLGSVDEYILQGHTATVRTVCFNPVDDWCLVSGGIVNPELKVWNVETQQVTRHLRGHKGAVYSLAASGDGAIFASVGTDKTLKLWDLRSSNWAVSFTDPKFSEMNCVALSNSLTQMNTQKRSRIASFYSHQSTSSLQAFQSLAAVAHSDGTVSIWNLTAGKLQDSYLYHNADCRSVEFSADGHWLLTSSFDYSIGVMEMATGETHKLACHSDRVVNARWHGSLPIILSTSADKTAKIIGP